MSAFGVFGVAAYALVGCALALNLWRKDVFFATFFTSLILYSVVAQVGYLVFPELSEVAIRMYFGPDILPAASAFSLLSLICLYACYFRIYSPLVAPVRIRLVQRPSSRLLFALIALIQVSLLAAGFLYFSDQLNYTNASDDDFIAVVGLPYRLWWVLFKFTPFTLIVAYAVLRQGLESRVLERATLIALVFAEALLFFEITAATGDRTDPLALVLGTLALEYFMFKTKVRSAKSRAAVRKRAMRYTTIAIAVLLLTVVLLSELEAVRGGNRGNDDLESGLLVQALFLKDYYTPFHVLIGAMANNYVQPAVVLLSNAANSLMFLKVDYLQFFVVEQWDPGSVTRSASPALFAFTEGYVALGWLGWIYNGVVWSLGYALWRSLSRSNDERFNAVAFAITIAMALVAARSQSSYFVKTLYLSFLPALILYGVASGLRWRGLRVRQPSNSNKSPRPLSS